MNLALLLLATAFRRRCAGVTDARGRANHVPRGQRATGASLRDRHGESAKDIEQDEHGTKERRQIVTERRAGPQEFAAVSCHLLVS